MNNDTIDPLVLDAANDDNSFTQETSDFFDRNHEFYRKASLSETCAADGYFRCIEDIRSGKLKIEDITQ